MATSTPVSIFFEEISDLNSSLKTFLTSVNQNPSRWQSVIHHITNDAFIYSQILQENINLQSRVELLESVDDNLFKPRTKRSKALEKNVFTNRTYRTWQSSFIKNTSMVPKKFLAWPNQPPIPIPRSSTVTRQSWRHSLLNSISNYSVT